MSLRVVCIAFTSLGNGVPQQGNGMRATLSDVVYGKEPNFKIRIARYFKVLWWVWGKNWSDYRSEGRWTIFILFYFSLFSRLPCFAEESWTWATKISAQEILVSPGHLPMGGPSYLVPETKVLQPFRLNNLCHVALVHQPVTHNIQPLLYSRLLFLPFGKSLI